MTKDYVLGFIFKDQQYPQTLPRSSNVLLMTKNKPDWQKGKLNGIGGKIESNENPLEAMIRESKEELTTLSGPPSLLWEPAGIMSGDDWFLWVFSTQTNLYLASAEKEKVAWYDKNKLPNRVIPNLHWLIPLSYARLWNPHLKFDISESQM